MEITLKKNTIKHITYAPPSKSVYHRALICAFLAEKETTITPYSNSDDILATIDCLRALGAEITENKSGYTVKAGRKVTEAVLDCKECGSTLRFMIPICAALGVNAYIQGSDGLARRPIAPLDSILENNGITITKENEQLSIPIKLYGKLTGNAFEVPGNISSQYITGMLLALVARKEDAILKITDKIESAPYIDITVNILKSFGFIIDKLSEREYHIKSERNTSPDTYNVEGDFSNAAFWLCAGAIADKDSVLTCKGVNLSSSQGDKKVIDVLKNFGANIEVADNTIQVTSSKLHCTEIDASDIPDLVPVLSVVASVAEGKTIIRNVERLTIKESNRVVSTVNMINAIGGIASYDESNIYISGVESLSGGTVDSVNDHRIAMSAAIASTVCTEEVTILGAEAVNKSYPTFFQEFKEYTKE